METLTWKNTKSTTSWVRGHSNITFAFLTKKMAVTPTTVIIQNFLAAFGGDIMKFLSESMGKKKAKQRAVSYNDFQNAFKQAECGTKNWQKRCQEVWARLKNNDLLLLESNSRQRRRLKPNKRKNKG